MLRRWFRAVALVLLLIIPAMLIACGGKEKEKLNPPINGVSWGGTPEQVKEVLGEPKEELKQEGLTQLLWEDANVWNNKASLLLRFDTADDLGLFYTGITFTDLNEEELLELLTKEYGEPTRKEEGKITFWGGKTVGELSEELQTQIRETLLGGGSEVKEAVWQTILKEPLVHVSAWGNRVLYSADHMALVKKLESGKDEASNAEKSETFVYHLDRGTDSPISLILKENRYLFVGEGSDFEFMVQYLGSKSGVWELVPFSDSEDNTIYYVDNFTVNLYEEDVIAITSSPLTSDTYTFRKKTEDISVPSTFPTGEIKYQPTNQQIPEGVTEAVEVLLEERRKETKKPEKFELFHVFYQDTKTAIVLFRGLSSTGGDSARPRLFVVLNHIDNAWHISESLICTFEENSTPWSQIEERICELFAQYRILPSQVLVDEALKQLTDDQVLSACFPAAGSRPETWKEVRDCISLSADAALAPELVCREYMRSFGYTIDFNDPIFLISLTKNSEIDEEKYPNIDFFFSEEGDGDGTTIYIAASLKDTGELHMKADPWAVY